MSKNPFANRQKLKTQAPKEHLSPYELLYGLRDNPFPSMGLFVASESDPRRNGQIYDDELRRDEEEEFFRKFVQPEGGEQPVQFGFLRLAPAASMRGNGKSAFLNRIMRRINDQEWGAWPRDPEDADLFALAVHMLPEPKKQNNVFELIRLMFDTMYERDLFQSRVDTDARTAVLADALTAEQLDDLANRPAEEVRGQLVSQDGFAALLDAYGVTRQNFDAQARHLLEEILPGCTSNAVVQGFLQSNFSLTGMWNDWKRRGVVEGDARWRKHGIDWLLSGLVPVLMMAGYRRLYVLLDEFEKIYMYQSARKRDEFLDVLRQTFFERSSVAMRRSFFSLVLTIHPSIYSYLSDTWRRVGLGDLAPLDTDRIAYYSVELKAANSAKLEHMLVRYIDDFRGADDDHHGTPYPFAPGALEPAMEKARFMPRGTLLFAHMILKQAVNESVTAPIARAFVERCLVQSVLEQDEEDRLFELPHAEVDLKG